MRRAGWIPWIMLLAGAALIVLGVYALGFLSEPSAIGRMRGALYVIGAGSIVLGLSAGVSALWMLLANRSQRP